MSAPVFDVSDGPANYLDVHYREADKPYGQYPGLLTAYLSERFLGAARGARLLDLGCGRGEFLHGFARAGFAVTGVDRSRPTQPRFSEPVLVADYEQQNLPFASGEMQVVFNKSVLEHLHDVSRVLRECHRVLAPGGVLISLVPDWRAQWRHFYDDWTHVRPFTLRGLTSCIESHGFTVQTAERFRQLPLLWKRPYLRPLAGAAALLPEACKRHKFVRFSKEWMLLVVATRAEAR
ncbi:MAG TPA: class I SAM-dependent methyltransferase [Polyangiaceae bacterium]